MKVMRKLATLFVAGSALLAAGGVAGATTGGDNQTAPASIVDTTKTGTIYLTKYDDGGGIGATAADGTDKTVPGANPIDGIEFTLTPINGIDFSRNDGLQKAHALDAAKIATEGAGALPEGLTLGDPQTATTQNGGKITWQNLRVGAYLLVESNSTVDGKTYRAAAPSIVFIPTTNPADQSSWITDDAGNYAVWVHPKNSLDENVKSVVDGDVHAGGDITFAVESTIPATVAGEKLTSFAFYDKLDPALDINGKDGSVTVKAGETELTKGVDFKVTIEDGADDAQDQIWVVLTESGLQKTKAAKDANGAAKAVMTFEAKVLRAAVVPNQAQVYKNDGSSDYDVDPDNPETPDGWEKTNTTTSAWGKVSIIKTNEEGAALAGAEFQVYACSVDQAGKGTISGDPLEVNGETTFTTNDEGKVTIDGLHVNNYADDADLTPETNYCLVETKAPANYELRHEPIPVKVTLTGKEVVTEEAAYNAQGELIRYSTSTELTDLLNGTDVKPTTLITSADVVNIPVKPKLPLTGGAGIAIFGLIGAAVIGGGLYAAKRNSRQAA